MKRGVSPLPRLDAIESGQDGVGRYGVHAFGLENNVARPPRTPVIHLMFTVKSDHRRSHSRRDMDVPSIRSHEYAYGCKASREP